MTLRGFFVTLTGLLLGVLALGTEIREFFIMALCVCGLIIYSFLNTFCFNYAWGEIQNK